MEIHYLNVDEGDCSIVKHDSGRISMIDAGAADEGVEAVHNEGAAAGCELFVPDGSETCGGSEDGFPSGAKADGGTAGGAGRFVTNLLPINVIILGCYEAR